MKERWFPLALSRETPGGHIFQAKLLDQELALWRDDGGAIHVWENRCPHRGVRLSIGTNRGSELQCRYHGWRFAAGDGRCTRIPAHPELTPPPTIAANVLPAVEAHGYIWSGLGHLGSLPKLIDSAGTCLRSQFIHASWGVVAAGFGKGYPLSPDRLAEISEIEPFIFALRLRSEIRGYFLLQPVSAEETILHGLLVEQAEAAERIRLLRYHNAQMRTLAA